MFERFKLCNVAVITLIIGFISLSARGWEGDDEETTGGEGENGAGDSDGDGDVATGGERDNGAGDSEGDGDGTTGYERGWEGNNDGQTGNEGNSEGDGDGQTGGESEGDWEEEGEGQTEGDGEGDTQPEGDWEGDDDGQTGGEGEGDWEEEGDGQTEGDGEGDLEGEGEGHTEDDGEGDTQPEGDWEGDDDGQTGGEGEGDWEEEGEGQTEGDGDGDTQPEGDWEGDDDRQTGGEGEGDWEEEGEGQTEGDGEGDLEGEGAGHTEDDGEGDTQPEGDWEGDDDGQTEGDGESDSIETPSANYENIQDPMFINLTKYLEKTCKDVKFCNHTGSGQPEYLKCCFRCDCGAECGRTGSCCPDIQTTSPDSPGRYIRNNNTVCKQPLMHRTKLRTYEFVVTCPLETMQDKRQKCENVTYEGKDSTDRRLIPVFDRVTVKNYQNIYCALCNGARMEDVSMWVLHRDCIGDDGGLFSDARRKKRSFTNCVDEYLPPDETSRYITLCYNHVIDTCDKYVTSSWERPDPQLVQWCEELDFNLYYHDHRTGITYKNIFCAFCNGIQIAKVIFHQCPAPPGDPGNRYFYLNTLYRHNIPSVLHEDQCGHGMAYDPLLHLCREIYCDPPLLLDVYGHNCTGSIFYPQTFNQITLSAHRINASQTLAGELDTLANELPVGALAFRRQLSLCGYSVFGKTSRLVSENSQPLAEIDWSNVPVNEIFVVVEVVQWTDTTDIYQAKTQIDDMKIAFEEFTILNYTFTVVEAEVDPWIMRMPTVNGSSSNLTLDGEAALRINPYDNTVLVGYKSKELNKDCFYDEYVQGYESTYIPCSTFVYNMTEHGIERVPAGIRFTRFNLEFGFGAFRSFNETHVRVCVANIYEKEAQSRGGYFKVAQSKGYSSRPVPSAILCSILVYCLTHLLQN